MYNILALLGQMTVEFIFFFSLGYVSYCLCVRWFSTAEVSVRLSAACIIFSWLLSIIFAVLISIGIFKPVPAVLVALLCAALTRIGLRRPTEFTNHLAYDVARVRDVIPDGNRNVVGWTVLTCFLLLSVLLAVRAVALPLLGWDSLTYHGLKSGLWVQEGGWPTLDAPGGWEYYRSFLGGGEVFTAWAMLFLRSDLLAGLPDVGFWLLFGLTTTCLARHFGVPRWSSVLISMAFLSTLEFSRMVGSGYVDTCANTFLLCGLLFLLRFARSRKPYNLCFAAASLGLASSVKMNMLATTILVAPAVIVLLLVHRRWSIGTLLLCTVLYAAPVIPWLLYNYNTVGYPLGSTPLSIGPFHLGTPPPNLVWFLTRPDLIPYKFGSEALSLFRSLKLYRLSLLLSLLGIPAVLFGVWRRSSVHILTVSVMAAVAALYFSPSFSVVRLDWDVACGRFLAPVVVLPAVAGLSALLRRKRVQTWVEAISAVCVITGLCEYLRLYVLGGHRVEILFLGVAAALIVVFYCVVHRRVLVRPARTRVGVALIAITFVIGAVVCNQFKDWFRMRAYRGCTTIYNIPRYWVPALSALDSESRPLRIAFTYGPQKISHGAFLAPFLGAHMENSLVYISPEKNGSVVPHHPAYIEKSNPVFVCWIEALKNASVTHVLCLCPPSKELEWVENHPGLFTRLAGRPKDWGLFRIDWLRFDTNDPAHFEAKENNIHWNGEKHSSGVCILSLTCNSLQAVTNSIIR